jgi:excisionase family DNA binding protein
MPDLSVKDAAVAAGVSERTVRRWISEGRLAGCYKVGGRVRIPELALRVPAEPYGERGTINDLSVLDSPARAREFELRRARIAFEEIDRIKAKMKPPSGPDDTAVAYIREWRDGPPRWERDDG